jgi:sulfite exporter TauE/SafE
VIESLPTLWPVLASAALVGLAGGVHCIGMCGGIVGVLAGATGQPVAPMRLHLSYSLGRIGSYALAGALAGSAGGALGWAGVALLGARGNAIGQSAFMLVASLMLIVLGLYLSGLAPAVSRVESLGAGFWRRLQPLARPLLPANTAARAFGLGAVWGFLPCGLVYAMLATAVATGSAVAGAAVMLAFGVGTLPNLLAVGFWLSRFRTIVRSPKARLAAGVAVCMFGIYGLVLFGQALFAGTDPHAHHHRAQLHAVHRG